MPKINETNPFISLCGCGKLGKYVTITDGIEVYACNKYQRCLTRDELEIALATSNKRLTCYQKAINDIDDYFEYSAKSIANQKKVYQILGNLTDSLSK
jgi:hypothetical protein